jgi:multicomponent Na+:H+ antiporter subunit D
VSQIGYIVLGISLANTTGFLGAMLHILNHGFMNACLFLVAGALMYKVGVRNIYQLGKISRRMPFTMGAFVIAAFSMVGVPPTCGFFSKWYLISGSIEANQWLFVVIILLSSLLTAVYFIRVVEIAYFRPASPPGHVPEEWTRDEIPPSMLIPLWILAGGIILLGVLNEKIISGVLNFALPAQF